MGVAYFVRVAEGDGGFDFAAVGGGLQPEPVLRLRFDAGGGHVLGLDHNGRAAGRRDQNIGPEAWVSVNGLSVLGTHTATGQHGLKQAAHCIVYVRFGLARHITPFTLNG